MSKRNKGGKPGLNARRKSALELLEANYAKFKEAGKDKAPWTTTRNGGSRKIEHAGRTFESECKRFNEEIAHLKSLIR